jgi:hypothetical protein
MEPEHISGPLRRVIDILEVYYTGDDFDSAIEQKLKELGVHEDQVRVIICIPAEMAKNKSDNQISLFS